ncbi:nuclear transport factor 2 family protein [Phenylobacterium terrae]|uniref:Nuclear transport factor 2 family protein n=1 Tax=Phenylobacterium terrae TaxID=2665495 RepID=A0ABW4N4U1_9CAUL
MTDPALVANRYIELWNETDPQRRRALLEQSWSPKASYVDPMAAVDGHEGLEALVAGVQQRFPGFRFRLVGAPDGYADKVRFTWELGPDGAEAPIQGSDVVLLEDGRVRKVIGFLDRVPAQA